MYRWHQDVNRMLRRWRLEIAKHERFDPRPGFRRYSSYDFAPVPPLVCDDDCHCYRGAGYFRKHHPLDCGHTRCGVCHDDKKYRCGTKRRRRQHRREAILFELEHA